MSGSAESEEFDADDEVDDVVDDDEGLDVDRVMKDMEIAKRRSAKGGEPAWRRLERRMEQQHTAELISDFEPLRVDLKEESLIIEGIVVGVLRQDAAHASP